MKKEAEVELRSALGNPMFDSKFWQGAIGGMRAPFGAFYVWSAARRFLIQLKRREGGRERERETPELVETRSPNGQEVNSPKMKRWEEEGGSFMNFFQ